MKRLVDYFGYDADRAGYLTHISLKHAVVFVEVPKTACTLVKRVLQWTELGGDTDLMPADPHLRKTSPLVMPGRLDGVDRYFDASGPFFRFSFVRNPFSRLLSCYLDKIVGSRFERDLRLPQLGLDPQQNVSFSEFLRRVADQPPEAMDIHWAPQSHLLALDAIPYNFIGRFESLRPDLERLLLRLGVDAPESLLAAQPAHPTGAAGRVAEHYTSELAELVREVYRDDFKRLGYGTDSSMA